MNKTITLTKDETKALLNAYLDFADAHPLARSTDFEDKLIYGGLHQKPLSLTEQQIALVKEVMFHDLMVVYNKERAPLLLQVQKKLNTESQEVTE